MLINTCLYYIILSYVTATNNSMLHASHFHFLILDSNWLNQKKTILISLPGRERLYTVN